LLYERTCSPCYMREHVHLGVLVI